jgi:hypothetical protein
MTALDDTTDPCAWTLDLPTTSGVLAPGDVEMLHAGPNGRVWWSRERGFVVEGDAA